MPSLLDQLRAQFPEFRDYSDADLVQAAAPSFGGSIDAAANYLGVQRSAPGFFTDIKRGVGGMVGGIGSTLRDVPGLRGVGAPLEQYGDDVAFRNPGEIHSFSDVMSRPGTAFREGVGEMVPQVGGAVAGALGGRALGGAIGMLGGPVGAAVGSTIGGFIGGALPIGTQTYGGIRSEQRAQGIDDIPRALTATVPAVALEFLGPEGMLINRIARRGVTGVTEGVARDIAGRGGLRYAGEQALKQGVIEGPLTEIPQTALERYGAYKDVTSPEAFDEYGVAGFKGFAGGSVFGGASKSIERLGLRNQLDLLDRGLGNIDAPMADQIGAMDLKQQFMRNEFGRPAAAQWYQGAMEELRAGRMADLASGLPVNLLDPITLDPLEDPNAVNSYTDPVPPGPFQGLPHSGAGAGPLGAPVEPALNRAVAIIASLQGRRVVPQSQEGMDLAWAVDTVTQTLGPQGYQQLLQQLTQNRAAKPSKTPKGKKAAPVVAAPTPAGLGDQFKAAGGIHNSVRKALNEATTPEQALEIIRVVVDNTPNLATRNFNALDTLHKQLTGETLSQWKTREDAKGTTTPAAAPVAGETFDATAFAKASAQAAVDQQGEYGGLESSVGAHFDNLRDTLREKGVTDQYAVRDAEDVYKNEVARLTNQGASNVNSGQVVRTGSGKAGGQRVQQVQTEGGTEGQRTTSVANQEGGSQQVTTGAQRALAAQDLIASASKEDQELMSLMLEHGADNYAAIAKATGKTRQGVRQLIEGGSGSPGLKRKLRLLAATNGVTLNDLLSAARVVRESTEGRLGLSPDLQESQLDESAIFGNAEAGVEQSSAIVNSVGGSQGDTQDSKSEGEQWLKENDPNYKEASDGATNENQLTDKSAGEFIPAAQGEKLDDAASDRAAASAQFKAAEAEWNEAADGTLAFADLSDRHQGQVVEEVTATGRLSGKTQRRIIAEFNDDPGLFANLDRVASESTPELTGTRKTQLRVTIRRTSKAVQDGEMSAEEGLQQIVDEADRVRAAQESRSHTRQRGAHNFLARLQQAVERGELSPEALDLAEWFVKQNPALAENVAISIRKLPEGRENTSGDYNPFLQMVRLFKGSRNSETAVHELLHHLERMMPPEVQQKIRQAWVASLNKARMQAIKSGDKTLIEFYDRLVDYHLDGNQRALEQAVDMLKSGEVSYARYQHVNPSEFWAVNATELVQSRFNASGSVFRQFVQWVKELIEQLKGAFGLSNQAPIIKALNSLMKADGEFKSGEMLVDAPGYNLYGGTKARLSRHRTWNFTLASLLDGLGVSADEVFEQTGWFKGVEGKWRFELDDSKAYIDYPQGGFVTGRRYELQAVFKHPTLYKAYPELSTLPVVFSADVDAGEGAYHHPLRKGRAAFIELSTAGDHIEPLLHEIQHAIQRVEGFARGDEPRSTNLLDITALTTLERRLARIVAEDAAIVDEFGVSLRPNDVAKDLELVRLAIEQHGQIKSTYDRYMAAIRRGRRVDKNEKADRQREIALRLFYKAKAKHDKLVARFAPVSFMLYEQVAGEVEARDVEGRALLSTYYRRRIRPYSGEDYNTDEMYIGGKKTLPNIERSVQRGGASTQSAESFPADEELRFTQDMVADAVKDAVTGWAKKGLQAVVFAHDLVDIAVKEGLTSAKGFFDLINAKAAERIRLEAEVDRIMTDASNLTDRTMVNRFLLNSTSKEKWGYQPTWMDEVKVDPATENEYNRLSVAGKKVVDQVFKFGHDSYNNIQALINKEISAEFDEQLAAATTPEERTRIEKERAKQIRILGRNLPKLNGPYAPLRRFGNYVMVAKSQQYLDAEGTKDKAKLDELRDQPNHYVVEFYDSEWEAKARARKLKPYFQHTDAFEKQKIYQQLQELPWAAIAKVKAAVNDLPETSKNKVALSNTLTDLYLTMLSESSARKAEMKRNNVAGANRDMLRAFASHGRATAHFLAALRDNKKIAGQFNAMQNEAKEGGQGTRSDRSRVFAEISARYAQSLDYRPTPFADKAMRISSFWMLVTSPGYYLQNSLQPFMLTLPMLNGRYGAGRSWDAMLRAYKEVTRYVPKMGHSLDIEKMNLTDEEKSMLRQLRDTGRLDLTIAQDLGRWTEGDSVLDRGVFGTVMRKIWNAPQQVEMLNRVVSALAAYRLSGGKMDAVNEVIDRTHGNYAPSNAPRLFNSGSAAKLMLQFRKFQLIQISLFARLVHDSLRGASAAEKSVARQALLWLGAHHMVMAGALGLPAANIVGMLLTALGGDDDEPKDAERMLRKWIGDKEMADLLLNGVPASLGINLTNKIGMGNAFSLLPFADKSPLDKAGYADTMVKASGAFFGGLLPRTLEGMGMIAKGDLYKGYEQMMPKGMQDAMKAWRFATEGITQRNGDVVMKPDEVALFSVLSQALGLPSTQITDRQRLQGDLIEMQNYYKERTGTLKRQYTKAYRENDVEDMADAREEWMAVAEAMKRNGFKPQPLSNLLKAPREQQKRERDVVSGVETKKSNRRFVEMNADL